MKRSILIFAVILAFTACDPEKFFSKEKEIKAVEEPIGEMTFAKGADISWLTEMESKGYRFYDASGKERECTDLLNSIGFNAVRYRVWVNPDGGWCAKEDVLAKALRAKKLGMDIMIDFHYSDWWADPGKQNVPAQWKSMSVPQLEEAVAQHTGATLQYLKDNGIDVTWVQVGNEVENGMLWETGRVKGNTAENFARYFNAGVAAVRRIYPQARVILHISNAWKSETLTWFYDLMKANNVSYDMIGLSLYPSYWENGDYPDWTARTQAAVRNFPVLHSLYGKEVMLVEFGMPASKPQESGECLKYILENTSKYDWFKGIFFWEPESEESRMNYSYGAFKDGCPTEALNPFKQ